MPKVIIVTECKEPWIYWWLLLTPAERRLLKLKYYPEDVAYLLDKEKKYVWSKEQPSPLIEEDWLQLALASFHNGHAFTRENRKEIWRQVHLMASERI